MSAASERAPFRSRRSRRRGGRAGGLLAVVAALMATAVLSVAAVTAVLWRSAPDVAGAEQLVARALAVQGARDAAGLPAPDRLGSAVVATKDSRFFAHHGIDVVGVVRSAVSAVSSPADPGGATLDVQLVKRLYPTAGGLLGKAQQLMLAVKLDHSFSKGQILEMYLSEVYFGHGFYGATAASTGYFGAPPGALSWAQASLLAGLVQAPSRDDPLQHLAIAQARQAHVLDRLAATGVLTRAQAHAARVDALHLRS